MVETFVSSITLYVPDVPKTIKFYEQVFDFQTCFIHEDVYGHVKGEDGIKIVFVHDEFINIHNRTHMTTSDPEKEPFGFGITLTVEDAKRYYAEVIQRGAVPIKPPAIKPWGDIVGYVRDLNGFIIEITTPVTIHMKVENPE